MLTRRQLLAQAMLACLAPALYHGALAAGSTDTPQTWLTAHMEEWRARFDLPGLSCGLMLGGRIVAEAAVGVRKWGDPTPLLPRDAQQIGSITKCVTDALVAKLIERDLLSWDTTLKDIYPELIPLMRPQYRDVTVLLLLAHLSGMPYRPLTEPDTAFDNMPLPEGRYQYVQAAVQDAPLAPPGTKFIYGGGPIIVAAMLERLTGRTWEQLTSEIIFQPLGMTTARFGAEPGRNMTGASVVWEHTYAGGEPIPLRPAGQYGPFFARTHGPAGSINCSPGDLLRFMTAYFPNPTGATSFFTAKSYKTLTTRVSGIESPGWGVDAVSPINGDALELAYGGSNLRNLAQSRLCPQTRNGFVWAANAWGRDLDTNQDIISSALKRPLVTGACADPATFPLVINSRTSGLTAEWWQYQTLVEGYIRPQHTFVLRPDNLENRFAASSPWADGNVVFDSGAWDGGGRLQYKPPESIFASWQHFALVVDRASGHMAIYRNGSREAFLPAGSGFLHHGQYTLYVGGDTWPFPGKLCEFRVWNYARSPAQIQANMHRAAPLHADGLLAHLKGPAAAGLPVRADP